MKMMTAKKAAEELGISAHLIRTWIKKGECPGVQQGNRFYVNVPMLENKINGKSAESCSSPIARGMV